jgi:uncharacterized protein YcbK (DUF882 family)
MITDFIDKPIGNSKYFKWKDALWLNQWEVCAIPKTDSIYLNIIEVCTKMDKIREIIQAPIVITSWYRPIRYNEFIRGAKSSAHILGKAVDFQVQNQTADDVRHALYFSMILLDIRMENLPKSNWVHIDTKVDGPMGLQERFFSP